MAQDFKVDVILEAQNNAQKEIEKLKKEFNRLEKDAKKSTDNIRKGFNNLTIAAWAAFWAMVFSTKSFLDEANEAIRVENQLNAVLESTKHAAWLTADEVKNMANEFQKVTTIWDDAIISWQNMLLTFTQIWKDIFPQATETMLDMATAMNNWVTPSAEQLKNQAIQLWKALNNPIEWVSALTRVWVKFTDQQKEQIKTLVENWKTMEAQKIILNELATEFGWSARAQVNSFEWQMLQLKNRIWDTKEEIGKAMIPVIENLTDTLTPVIDKTLTWIQANPQLITTIITMITVASSLTIFIKWLSIALAFLAANPIIAVIAWVGALSIALILLIKNANAASIALNEVFWHDVQDQANLVNKNLKSMKDRLAKLNKEWDNAVPWINRAFWLSAQKEIESLQKSIKWAEKKLKEYNKMWAFTASDTSTIAWNITKKWSNIKWWINHAKDSIVKFWQNFVNLASMEKITDKTKDSIDWVGWSIKKSDDKVKEAITSFNIFKNNAVWNIEATIDKIKDLAAWWQKIKDSIQDVEDKIWDMKTKFSESIDELDWKISDFEQSIKDVNSQFEEAKWAAQQDELNKVFERRKQILEELDEIEQKRKDWDFTWEDLEKEKKLKDEKKLSEEILWDKLKELEAYDALSETAKIQLQTQEKIAELEAQQQEKIDRINKEIEAINNRKEALETEYNNNLTLLETEKQVFLDAMEDKKDAIIDQIKSLDSLWKAYKDIISLQQKAWLSKIVWAVPDWKLEARANWWPVNSWQTYLVWEKWPELFTPNNSWNITPNNKLSGWVNVNVNFQNVNVSNQSDEQSLANTIVKVITRQWQLGNLWII